MQSKFIENVNSTILEVRNYVEHTQIPEIKFLPVKPENYEELHKMYTDASNEVIILKNKLSQLDYLVYLLSEAIKGLSPNTPTGSKSLSQLKGTIESVKLLRKVVSDFDDAYYRIMNYYEKWVGMRP